MRKVVMLLALVLALVFPQAAQAQSDVALGDVVIQLWPEYDKAAVLVIYDFTVAAGTNLPAVVNLRMPAGAQLLAVAREENGGLINVDYLPPKRQGTDDVLSISITNSAPYHVEFYVNYTRSGNLRNFEFLWPADYAVANLKIRFQEPVGAKNVTVDPEMTPSGPEQDGFTYRNAEQTQLPAGKPVAFKFSYEKDNDNLSSASLGVQPTAPLDQPVSGQAQFMTYLPWFLGALGVVLIVGGGMWYWLTGRTSSGSARGRKKRHAAREEAEGDAQVYCSQCGKRAQGQDRFCRACGARLRSQE